MTYQPTGIDPGDDRSQDIGGDVISDTLYQAVKLIDSTQDSTTPIGTASNPLHVQSASTPLPSDAATATNQQTANTALSAIQAALELIDNTVAGNELQVDVVTSALPSGAATAAKQDTGNTSLSSIDGKITACNTGAVVISSGSVTATISGTVTVDSELTTADLDTGGGTDTRAVVGLVVGGSGGGTLVSTSNPLPIGDNGGSLTVDGTVAVSSVAGVVQVGDNSSSLTVDDGGSSLTVDGSVSVSGNVTVVQGTGSNLHAVVDSGTITTITNVVHVDDNSSSLTVDDGGSTISIDDGGGSITVDGSVTATISGTVTVDSELTTADMDTGGGTDTRAVVGIVLAASGGGVLAGTANPIPISDNSGSITVDGTVTIQDGGNVISVDDNGSTISIDDGSGSITVDGTVAATQSGTWTVQPGNTANTTPWLVSSIETPGTPTQSSVAASASSVTLLSANASRKKVVIYNDSTSASLYVRLNASAANTSNFTYKLYPSGYLEEYNYTGEIRGIWSAASGNARITEYA